MEIKCVDYPLASISRLWTLCVLMQFNLGRVWSSWSGPQLTHTSQWAGWDSNPWPWVGAIADGRQRPALKMRMSQMENEEAAAKCFREKKLCIVLPHSMTGQAWRQGTGTHVRVPHMYCLLFRGARCHISLMEKEDWGVPRRVNGRVIFTFFLTHQWPPCTVLFHCFLFLLENRNKSLVSIGLRAVAFKSKCSEVVLLPCVKV